MARKVKIAKVQMQFGDQIAHCASQGAAIPCHDDEDDDLRQRMDEVGTAAARDEADWAENQTERDE